MAHMHGVLFEELKVLESVSFFLGGKKCKMFTIF
jgi:hypothetical protein